MVPGCPWPKEGLSDRSLGSEIEGRSEPPSLRAFAAGWHPCSGSALIPVGPGSLPPRGVQRGALSGQARGSGSRWEDAPAPRLGCALRASLQSCCGRALAAASALCPRPFPGTDLQQYPSRYAAKTNNWPGGLTPQTFISSLFQWLEVQGQSVGGLVPSDAAIAPRPHTVGPLSVLYPDPPSCVAPFVVEQVHPNDPLLTESPLQRPSPQVEPNSEAPGLRTSMLELRVDVNQPTTPIPSVLASAPQTAGQSTRTCSQVGAQHDQRLSCPSLTP